MKKFRSVVCLLLVLVMAFALSACTPKENTPSGDGAGKVVADPNYPASGVLTVDIAYKAGGSADRLSREIAALMAEELKCASNCQNVTGGSASVAGLTVLDEGKNGDLALGTLIPAPSSWYTLGYTEESHWSDWYAFIGGQSTFGLYVKGDSPYKTFDDLAAAIKAAPGTIKWGNSGLGTAVHLSCQMLLDAMDLKCVAVPYSGGSEAAKNVLAGEVTFMWASYSDVIDYLHSGDLLCLGTVSKDEIEMTLTAGGSYKMPSLYSKNPAAAEAAASLGLYGVMLPRYVDDAQVLAFKKAFEKIAASDEFKKFVTDLGQAPRAICGEEADKMLASAECVYAWAIYDAGIAAQGKSPADINIPRPADFDWAKVDKTAYKAWPQE